MGQSKRHKAMMIAIKKGDKVRAKTGFQSGKVGKVVKITKFPQHGTEFATILLPSGTKFSHETNDLKKLKIGARTLI